MSAALSESDAASVRFTAAAAPTNLLVESRSADVLPRLLEQMARFDVVVLDELGYVPFDKLGADLLFSFITKVYERRSRRDAPATDKPDGCAPPPIHREA
jgi:DNA replication protein DnaC